MNQKPALGPFSCQYTPQIPELLMRLNCTIAISTYQAGKVVFISAKDENSLIQLPRTFQKPMGIAEHYKKDKLAIACKDEVVVFANSQTLAQFYPKSPNKYDAIYMPRKTYHTGALDIHDLHYGSNDRLYAVNTMFSCLMTIDDDYNFTPYWKPHFIDKLVSEDRCHLNGMAMSDGKPKYASAFNAGNTRQSWRENITTSGIIIDVEQNEIIASGLAMPHTPRIYKKELYVLLSATGELVRINKDSGSYDVITKVQGFVRGMDICQDYLFIGLSKLRENSSTFGKLDFAKKSNQAGILVIHLPTGAQVGSIMYQTSLDEIYDVHILANKSRPNILNTMTEDYKQGVMIPESTFWARPKTE
jgi:uncharacterized protein (TIGR03032 family)